MGDLLPQNLDAIRNRLLSLRCELEKQAAENADARQTVELDQSRVGRLSRMDALQSQAMAVETGRRRNIEIERVAAALKRLDEGDYGFCVNCGEDIQPKRLALDPAVPVCINCAGK